MIISKVFFYLCLAFILGITLGFLNEQKFLFLFIFSAGLLFIFSYFFIEEFYEKQKIKLSLLFLIFFFMIFSVFGGWFRYNTVANPKITQTDLSYFNDYQQRIKITGVVHRIEQRVKNNHLVIRAEKIKIQEKEEQDVRGRVLVFVPRLLEVNYGDRISLEGQLKSPQPINGFNWPKHLANEGIFSIMTRPWVTIIEKNQGSFIMSQLYFLNSFFQERINRFLPHSESAILSGMLLGNRGEIPDKINDNFFQTGIGHILSISGLHITIISVIIFWIILGLGFWRKQAFILTSLFLIFYILMVGAPPPAIRAGIMGFLFLLAQYFGRGYSFQNAIMVAATLILIFNPLSLFYDISFQFSFISILAMFLLFPIFKHFVYEKFGSKIKIEKKPLLAFFLNTFLISLAILLFLSPLTIYYFDNFPIISPLANFLAIPFSSLILFFGIIFLLISVIWSPLSMVFGSIVYLSLTFLIYLNTFLANLPLVGDFQFENISIYAIVIYYLVLLIIIWRIKKIIPTNLLLKI